MLMAVSLDTADSVQGGNTSTLDLTITLDASADFLFAGLCSSDSSPVQASGAIFEPAGDNDAFTNSFTASNSPYVEISGWYLIAPASTGSRTVRGTWPENNEDEMIVAAFSFIGAHQTTPLGTPQTANADSTTAQVTGVGSASDEIVVDVMYSLWNGQSPGSGQTEQWEELLGATGGAGSTKTGEASTTMSWTRDAAGFGTDWAIGAVGVRPAAAAPAGPPAGTLALLGVGI